MDGVQLCSGEEGAGGRKVQEGAAPLHCSGQKWSPVPHHPAWPWQPFAADTSAGAACKDGEAGVKARETVALWIWWRGCSAATLLLPSVKERKEMGMIHSTFSFILKKINLEG